MQKIILASGSPRRKELLTQMGVEFVVESSRFDEYLDHGRPPAEVAVELALGKVRAVSKKYPDALVIGGDTIATIGGQQLDKPGDITVARAWLRNQAGKDVLVASSVVVACRALRLEVADVDEAIVRFAPYNKEDQEAYLATGDWRDKAGGWGIQSGAASLVAHMRGRYDTVLGMPTHMLAEMLRNQGVPARSLKLVPPVPQK